MELLFCDDCGVAIPQQADISVADGKLNCRSCAARGSRTQAMPKDTSVHPRTIRTRTREQLLRPSVIWISGGVAVVVILTVTALIVRNTPAHAFDMECYIGSPPPSLPEAMRVLGPPPSEQTIQEISADFFSR